MITKLLNLLRRQPEPAATPVPQGPAPLDATTLKSLLGRDETTGLPNRTSFSHILTRQCDLAALQEARLSLLMIMWDGYADAVHELEPPLRKQVQAGMAKKLRAAINRNYDVLASLGDGSFALLLPFTDPSGADKVARGLQAAFISAASGAPPEDQDGSLTLWDARPEPAAPEAPEDTMPGLGDGPRHAPFRAAFERSLRDITAPEAHGTLSIGIACYGGRGVPDADRLLQAAQEACAMAHLDGGNRVLRRDTPITRRTVAAEV